MDRLGIVALALCGGPAIAAKTPPTSKPAASTETAEQVTYATANLYANINPNGDPTSFYFQLGLSSAFTANTFVQSAGAGRTALRVGTPVTGLTPDTTYYYRVVALNAKGQTLGAVKHFVTPTSAAVAGLHERPQPGRLRRPAVGAGRALG